MKKYKITKREMPDMDLKFEWLFSTMEDYADDEALDELFFNEEQTCYVLNATPEILNQYKELGLLTEYSNSGEISYCGEDINKLVEDQYSKDGGKYHE